MIKVIISKMIDKLKG